MRILFSVVSLLLVVLVIGVLTRKQLSAVSVPAAVVVNLPGGTVPMPAHATASEVKKSVEGILQQERPGLKED